MEIPPEEKYCAYCTWARQANGSVVCGNKDAGIRYLGYVGPYTIACENQNNSLYLSREQKLAMGYVDKGETLGFPLIKF